MTCDHTYSTIANFHTIHITAAHAEPFHSAAVSTSRSVVMASNSRDSSTAQTKSSFHRFPCNWLSYNYKWLTSRWAAISHKLPSVLLPTDFHWLLIKLSSQSQSHIATDGQSVSKSWCRAPSGTHDQIFGYYCLTVTVLFLGAPSLTGGRVCFLYMLLGLSNAVFLGSESLGTRDRILLSQISDFPFCRLLRLAGSQWRYLTPPPHVIKLKTSFHL
jgi:hypothetical protein